MLLRGDQRVYWDSRGPLVLIIGFAGRAEAFTLADEEARACHRTRSEILAHCHSRDACRLSLGLEMRSPNWRTLTQRTTSKMQQGYLLILMQLRCFYGTPWPGKTVNRPPRPSGYPRKHSSDSSTVVTDRTAIHFLSILLQSCMDVLHDLVSDRSWIILGRASNRSGPGPANRQNILRAYMQCKYEGTDQGRASIVSDTLGSNPCTSCAGKALYRR